MCEGMAPANEQFFNGWKKGEEVRILVRPVIKTIRTSLRRTIQA
jgi:hypothetical protein